MKVFVTGASGFVGSAVAEDLLRRGHKVTGLARSKASEDLLRKNGIDVVSGDLTDLELIKKCVKSVDGVIHLGFNHDFSKFAENCQNDRLTLLAMGEALAETQKPLVVTSGIGLFPGGTIAEDMQVPKTSLNPRAVTEFTTQELVEKGINVSVVRLPPTTHGVGDHGFVPMLIAMAKTAGFAAYVNEGQNTWPAVHRFDAAKVYSGALEKAARGSAYHPVAEAGIPFKKIAEAISKRLNIPVKSISEKEAEAYYGWFVKFARLDLVGMNAQTKAALNWEPTEITLFEDLENPDYC